MKRKTPKPPTSAEIEAAKRSASNAIDSLTQTSAVDAAAKAPAPQAPKHPVVQRAPRDGFSDIDDGNTSYIRGTRIKFTNDWTWVTDTEDVIKPDREFVVINFVRTVQKWLPTERAPVETIELDEFERVPDLAQWNEDAPPSEWCVKFGKDVGPWKACTFVYMLDPTTCEGFTWPCDTHGGFKALDALKTATKRRRLLENRDNIYPRVTLADLFMPTQYGGRQRPHFVIKDDWQTLGAPSAPSASALDKPAEKPAELAAKPADNDDSLHDTLDGIKY